VDRHYDSPMRVGRLLAWLVAASFLALSACGGETTTSDRSAEETTTSRSPTSNEAAGPRDIDVTVNGLDIEGRCSGEDVGEPAVILLHGNGGDQNDLANIEHHLGERTLVCTYNRPGVGVSEVPKDLPRPVTEVVQELAGFLDAAAIDPPYFVVGFSQGGEIGFLFAQAYPEDVAGFVSINPVPPPYRANIDAAKEVVTKEELETILLPDFKGENPEQISHTSNDSMLTDPLPPTTPYHILFDEDCGGDAQLCAKVLKFLPGIYRSLAQVGAGGRFTWVRGAGHDIDQSRPDVVEETIDEVWELASEP
jgi:dienelactone hydrolase